MLMWQLPALTSETTPVIKQKLSVANFPFIYSAVAEAIKNNPLATDSPYKDPVNIARMMCNQGISCPCQITLNAEAFFKSCDASPSFRYLINKIAADKIQMPDALFIHMHDSFIDQRHSAELKSQIIQAKLALDQTKLSLSPTEVFDALGMKFISLDSISNELVINANGLNLDDTTYATAFIVGVPPKDHLFQLSANNYYYLGTDEHPHVALPIGTFSIKAVDLIKKVTGASGDTLFDEKIRTTVTKLIEKDAITPGTEYPAYDTILRNLLLPEELA